jgi:hypothetical protein
MGAASTIWRAASTIEKPNNPLLDLGSRKPIRDIRFNLFKRFGLAFPGVMPSV